MGTPQNPLSMSDEEIANMVEPPAVDSAGNEGGDPPPPTDVEDDTLPAPGPTDDDVPGDPEPQDPDPDDSEEETDSPAPTGEGEDEPDPKDGDAPDEDKEKEDGTPDPDPKKEDKLDLKDPADKNKEPDKPKADGSTDYKAFYEQVMAPFTANGKTIKLNSPDEVIQLMQMGANYTRKMQAIAPHRKILLMLENNKLLDEDRLSYLIDIDKKNPEAIRKLVKEAGIDPLDLNTDEDEPSTYQTGNHRVSDEEAAFRGVLDDMVSTPDGKKTLHLINTEWDQASKEVLWEQPEVMQIIHSQRENGIYERISTEIERQRTLGMIPPQVPFLQAYKKIGEDMAKAGLFNDLVPPQNQGQQQPPPQPVEPAAPVAKRVSTPKPSATNGDKVSAASPTRSTPRKATTVVNPLSLPDDEFEKQFAAWEGRV